MQKRVQLPNGRIVEVPADITPQEELALVTQLDRESQFDEVAGGARRAVMGNRDNRAASIPDMLAQAASMTPQGRILGAARNAPRIVSNLISRFPRLANAAVQTGAAATAGGVGSVVRSGMDDTPESMGDVADNALMEMGKQGVVQLLNPAITSGGRGIARAFMRRGLGVSKPAAKKYVTADGKDLIDEALDRRVLVTKGGFGFKKAQGMRQSAQAQKVDAINNARPVTILTEPIQRGAADQTIDTAVGQQIAGMRPTMDPSPAVARFGGGRPGISLQESELAKRQLDNAAEAAHQAKRMGKPPSLEDAEGIALSDEILKSQDAIVPGMRGMNREIRQTMGLENAVRDRLAQPATGMADDATGAVLGMGGDPATALSLRALRGPAALSALANLINELSKGGRVAPAAARALMMTSRDK